MSSPVELSVEDDGVGDEELERLLSDPVPGAVIDHLLDAGDCPAEDLIPIASAAIASTQPTDDDRVRAAVLLQIDSLPALREHDLITVEDDTVAMAFLPTDVIQELQRIVDESSS